MRNDGVDAGRLTNARDCLGHSGTPRLQLVPDSALHALNLLLNSLPTAVGFSSCQQLCSNDCNWLDYTKLNSLFARGTAHMCGMS